MQSLNGIKISVVAGPIFTIIGLGQDTGMPEPSKWTQPIVDGYDNNFMLGHQFGWVVKIRITRHIAATMNPKHYWVIGNFRSYFIRG